MPRLRSVLTLGLSDFLAALAERLRAVDGAVTALATQNAAAADRADERLAKLEADVAALRALVIARDERAQKKLKAGLSSAVNLMSVLPRLQLEGVVPPFSHQGFEVTGELAAYLFHLIREHRPKLIFELGSGSSTLLLAASARANGCGRVVSVEHDPEHRRRTAQLVDQAQLSDWVELVAAPLVRQDFGNLSLQWYDVSAMLRRMPERIDLVLVDGPPGRLQPLSRYPALPVLAPYLSPQALIVVDDGRRDDEIRMIELWRELDAAPFESESLDFLPRAPVLLTFGAGHGRVAELRRLREARAAGAGPDGEPAADRRSSAR